MRSLKEAYEVWDNKDIEDAPDDEKEFVVMNSEIPNWIRLIKLRTFYNWNNVLDEILYFYKKDINDGEFHAISFGKNAFAPVDQSGYLIRMKKFTYEANTLNFIDDPAGDPWEIGKNDLEESDTESIEDLIRNIFIASEVKVWDNALRFLT